MVHCAISSIGEALFTLELGVATGAGPGDDARSELCFGAQELGIISEVTNEIECFIIS
jgi:hypothetical protein